ncbi:MAG TPA: sigma-70 family RNA polymerase sigma factor [Gaiellales bacterium]
MYLDTLVLHTMTSAEAEHPIATPEDLRTVAALRAGDERVFRELVERYHASLIRVALLYVRTRAVAEEVVQDTWIGVLRSLPRFEGRSSLRTWIFRILANQARTRARREARSVPFSSLAGDDDDSPTVDPDRFLAADHPAFPGHWASPPQSWAARPEEELLARETRELVLAAIEALPPSQRAVISLRDVEGWSSEEVCDLLEISEGNQRVLLHRARAKVREALEEYLDGRAA